MTARGRRRTLLLAYPARWRARYEAEVLDLLDDEHGDGRLGMREAADLVVGGLVQRCRSFYDVAEPRADRTQSTGLLAWGWLLFVIGGIGFAKEAEHFGSRSFAGAAVPHGHVLAGASYVTIQVAAVATMVLMAAISLPAILVAGRSSSAGGRRKLRRALLGAVAAMGVATAWTAWIVTSSHARGASSGAGPTTHDVLVLGVTALVVSGALVALTRIATVAMSVVAPTGPARALRAAAWAIAACVALAAVAEALWWVVTALDAVGFLGPAGGGAGREITGWPAVGASQALVACGAVACSIGALRVGRGSGAAIDPRTA